MRIFGFDTLSEMLDKLRNPYDLDKVIEQNAEKQKRRVTRSREELKQRVDKKKPKGQYLKREKKKKIAEQSRRRNRG